VKLDKRHLVVSLILLIASIVYNVWVFTRPADDSLGVNTNAVQPIDTSRGVTVDGASQVVIDPTQVADLPDVALDRLPEWPRDPFANLRREAPIVAAVTPVSEPIVEPEPDPVVGSILYSTNRRLVTIEGRVARIGDVVAGVRIVDILPNAVVVESPIRGRRTLPVGAGGAAP